MACQTTYPPQALAEVEISEAGSVWTDISAMVMTLTQPALTRQTTDTFVGAGDVALVTVGKKVPVDLVFTFLYSEGSSDAWKMLQAIFDDAAKACVHVRWTLKGGDATELRFNTSTSGSAVGAVPITSLVHPGFDKASGASPVMGGFTVRTPAIYQETISS